MILASLIEKDGLSKVSILTHIRELREGVAEVAAVAVADYGSHKTDISPQTTIESNSSSLERLPNTPNLLSRPFKSENDAAGKVATATVATVATLQEPRTTEGIIGIQASATKAAGTWRRLFGNSRRAEEIERQLIDLNEWQSKPRRVPCG